MLLREGIVPLGVVGAATWLLHGSAGWLAALPLWLLFAWLLRIYWERRPPVPAEPDAVLSPVPGRVVQVVEQDDPWLDRRALRVSIKLAFPGIVPLRSPTEAKVLDTYTRRGAFGGTQRVCREHESPDCYGQWLQTDEGEDVLYAVSSHLPLSRARFEYAPGERVGQGQRCGFFYGASVADVLMPVDCTAAVSVGDRVEAGQSVLARLARD